MRARWARLVGASTLVALVALAATCSGISGASAAAPAKAVTVPITTQQVGQGTDTDSYVVVRISVGGGKTVPVQLDTGSSGLLILSSAVGGQVRSTGQQIGIPYLHDTVEGTLDTGPMVIGGLSTPNSTGFVVMSASANPTMASHFRSNGVVGVLGIGVANGATLSTIFYSPLLQLPAFYRQSFSLKVSAHGAGTLTIGPTSTVDSAAGTVTAPMTPAAPNQYPNGAPGYQKDVNLCWSFAGGSPNCGATDMDIGTAAPIFDPTAIGDAPVTYNAIITPGTIVTATAPGGQAVWRYTAGTTAATNLTPLAAQGYSQYNTGINFFFTHTVTYDMAKGEFLIGPA
ncbi:MAG TPA: hypothetical protein VNV87_14195 [Acidimicrobiales bacterium]|jgi:hypothetical protein|nr:hypothetical protein [Acidimicrobiales bacterium]